MTERILDTVNDLTQQLSHMAAWLREKGDSLCPGDRDELEDACKRLRVAARNLPAGGGS